MGDQLTLLRSTPSYHQVFSLLAELQVVPPRHCVSRVVHQRALFERLKPFWNLVRLVSQCLDTWEMQSVARCLAWVLLAGDIAIGRPTSGLGRPVYEVRQKRPQLAHGSHTCIVFNFPSFVVLEKQHLPTQLDHPTAPHDQTKPQARQDGLAL